MYYIYLYIYLYIYYVYNRVQLVYCMYFKFIECVLSVNQYVVCDYIFYSVLCDLTGQYIISVL